MDMNFPGIPVRMKVLQRIHIPMMDQITNRNSP